MCGIVGIASIKGNVRGEIVESMRDTMRHRGPDDQGIWISPDRHVGFGHRRLSIIDLSPRGHQPMFGRDGRTAITFNGEIYNYRELRDDLEAGGFTFASESDTEVLLHSYERWGTQCLARLNGMFAFVIYDADKRLLFAARDRAGEKPFFYSHGGGRFLFASELKALMADPDLPRKFDVDALNYFFAFGYVPREKCILAGVSKLPQGHALTFTFDDDAVRKWPYWELPEPGSAAPSGQTGDEYVERLESLLRDSVRRQMYADVPVGILLSGGLDSSLVTAAAASASSRPVKTFTISFPGHGSYDESSHARIVARHFGTDHHELVAEETTVDLLPMLAAQYDEPMADSSMVPTFLVSRMIRSHATVAVGGDGADELFGGYPHHAWVQRQEHARHWIPSPLRRMTGAAAASLIPLGMKGRNWIVGFTADLGESISNINIFFDSRSRARLLEPLWQSLDGRHRAPEKAKSTLSPRHYSPLQQVTRADFMTYLCDDILVKVDRASMLTSLEVRAPWLDYRIIEMAFGALPDELRATGSGRKIILRKLGRRLLPPAFDIARKQGFSIPLAAWFRGAWGESMREVLRTASPDIFAPAAIEALLRGQERGYSNSHRLFAITMFELWRRAYGVELP